MPIIQQQDNYLVLMQQELQLGLRQPAAVVERMLLGIYTVVELCFMFGMVERMG
jgi:hypothetical protein